MPHLRSLSGVGSSENRLLLPLLHEIGDFHCLLCLVETSSFLGTGFRAGRIVGAGEARMWGGGPCGRPPRGESSSSQAPRAATRAPSQPHTTPAPTATTSPYKYLPLRAHVCNSVTFFT